MAAELIIDALVQAYNDHDARAFADFFGVDAPVYEHPQRLTQQGREEIFTYYQQVFAQFPQNQTTIIHRIVIGNRVIDHERVRRSDEHEAFDILAIYEISEGLIQRLDFIRDAHNVAQTAS